MRNIGSRTPLCYQHATAAWIEVRIKGVAYKKSHKKGDDTNNEEE